MNRRLLFKHAVALFGIPAGLSGSASTEEAILLPRLGLASGPAPSGSVAPPPWLAEWLRLPMLPVVSEADLEGCHDQHVLNVASRIRAGFGGGEALVFRYHGGSEPGRVRSVLPVLLFRKFDPAGSDGGTKPLVTTPGPIYLLAHCRIREAARTFRLDRMALVPG